MTEPVIEATFPARVPEVPRAVAAVVAAVEGERLDPETLMHLELCLEEAAVNVCDYAYPAAEGSLVVRAWRAPERLTLQVEDHGVAFDPLSLAPPDTEASLEERPIGGLGVHLIRRLMNEVRYERIGEANVLTMVLHLTAPGGLPHES